MKAFEDPIQKYVRLPGNEIIIFSMLLQHSTLIDLKPVTDGLCIVDPEKMKVDCFGLKTCMAGEGRKHEFIFFPCLALLVARLPE